MEKIVLIVHSLAALVIIALILLQQGKGAAAGASFGAGASQTVFGSEGSGNFFTRATWTIATLFFLTSFGLAVMANNQSKVVAGGLDIPAAQQEIPASAGDVPVSEVPAVMESAPVETEVPESKTE